MESGFNKAEISAINIVLKHADNQAVKSKQHIKANRIMALRFVFNIPLSIEEIYHKGDEVLSREDITLAIDAINHYLTDTALNKVSRHEDLRNSLKKLKVIRARMDHLERFVPNIDHQKLNEIDLFNIDQGLQRLKDEIEVSIDENEIQPLFNLFNDELSEEVRSINRLGKTIMALKNITISRLVEILEESDITESIYNIDLAISGLNLYEAEQRTWEESKNLLNTRETMLKLFYVRSKLNAHALLKRK